MQSWEHPDHLNVLCGRTLDFYGNPARRFVQLIPAQSLSHYSGILNRVYLTAGKGVGKLLKTLMPLRSGIKTNVLVNFDVWVPE